MNIDIAQLEFIDQDLRNILVCLESETGIVFTITSLYRIDDAGVHGTLPLRGADLRMRNAAVGDRIAQLINAKWQYDRRRPELTCAVLHGEGSNLHLHIQVHPRTKRRT